MNKIEKLDNIGNITNEMSKLDIDKKPFFNNKNDLRTVTICEGISNRIYKMSIYDYINYINSFNTSKNAVDICISIGCYDPYLKSAALTYAITYKQIFKGIIHNDKTKKILINIGCDSKPTFNSKIIKTISYIKWQIQEYKNKQIFTVLCSEWIGVLSGLLMYFDDLDVLSNNKTDYAKQLSKDIIITDL